MLTCRSTRARLAVAGLAVLGLTAAGCGSSSSSRAGVAAATRSGPVDVLYAGSLVDMMEKQIGPGFRQATGYSVTGYSAGSKEIASEIKGEVRKGDVFISASPTVNASLEGAANGNWVSWYLTYATSGLVLGYNPNSKFAADLKSRPWYQVLTEPGIRVGLTSPATDPKGKLSVEALDAAASAHHLPALSTLAGDSGDQFPEQTLVGRLQSGQLDAGFFYNSEAVAAKLPTVPLAGTSYQASYTITMLNNAPHRAAAEAFISYLLGPSGQRVLGQDGFTVISPPTVTGTGLPSALQSHAS